MGRRENTFKWRSIVLCVMLLGSGLRAGPSQAKYGGGSGTTDDPYQIWTPEQMNAIGAEPNDFGKHFKLMADIDLSAYEGDSFNLIGYLSDRDRTSYSFWGVFDGNGHTISNLTYIIERPDPREGDPSWLTAYGLFRYLSGEVRDLGLIDPTIRPAATCAYRVGQMGALAGYCLRGSISNCYVQGGHVSADSVVGGLVGILGSSSSSQVYAATVSDCYASCKVSRSFEDHGMAPAWATLSNCLGGLVGRSQGTILRSYTCGNVEAAGVDAVGGLVGHLESEGTIEDSYSRGHVSGATDVGGLVGRCEEEADIVDCYFIGSVLAEECAGGLVGRHDGDIRRCYATACVSASADQGGGLVGLNHGTIQASWAYGSVTGKRRVGGFVGYNEARASSAAIRDCYARGSVFGEDVVGGLVGANDAGTVSRCYSATRVRGSTQDGFIGGLIGANPDVPMTDSFWDIDASGVSASDGGVGKTTTDMQHAWIYLAAGWDLAWEPFNGVEDIWNMCSGRPIYPKLAWEPILVGDFVDPEGVNLEDVAFLAQHWLQAGALACNGPDANLDTCVDMKDFALLGRYWHQGVRKTIFATTLDVQPPWTREGQWQFGTPTDGGETEHGHPDPTGGHTGDKVYGVNLTGDYRAEVDGPHYLTAGPFDCRLHRNIRLQFARWLNTDEADFVRATVEASIDGTSWILLWEHEDTEAVLMEDAWQTVLYSLGPIADCQENVYVRWGYEIRDKEAWPMSGWNIDDVVLTGTEQSPF